MQGILEHDGYPLLQSHSVTFSLSTPGGFILNGSSYGSSVLDTMATCEIPVKPASSAWKREPHIISCGILSSTTENVCDYPRQFYECSLDWCAQSFTSARETVYSRLCLLQSYLSADQYSPHHRQRHLWLYLFLSSCKCI